MAKGKFGRALARAKSKAMTVGKGESFGKVGREFFELGTHALLAITSKNMESVGPIPLRPDVIGMIAGGAAMMFGKGHWRKNGRSFLKGAAHAGISRMAYTGQLNIITNGTDVRVEGGESKKKPTQVNIGNDAVRAAAKAVVDDDDDDDDVVDVAAE